MAAAAEPRVRRPVLGFAMVLAAATLFGINGSVAKVALSSGLSSLRLTEARCAGACVGLCSSCSSARRGACASGAASCCGSPSSASSASRSCSSSTSSRSTGSQIGIALLIQYLGPLLIALWARTFATSTSARVWAGAGALARRALAHGRALERRRTRRARCRGRADLGRDLRRLPPAGRARGQTPRPGLADGVGLRLRLALFWAIAQPWWSFPGAPVAQTVSLQGARVLAPAGLGARPLGRRPRVDRAVLAHRRRFAT